MKLLVLGLISIAILIYLIYNECWKVHRCTPFPNMKRNAEDRTYGGSTVGERRNIIDDIKEGMADMPAFDEQAKMESDYIKDRGSHFGHREDDPKGMLDVNKELTQFKNYLNSSFMKVSNTYGSTTCPGIGDNWREIYNYKLYLKKQNKMS